MSKAKQAVKPTVTNEIAIDDLSMRDIGYRQAVTADVSRAIAIVVMNRVPAFPESIPDESKAELVQGYTLRFNEANPAVAYCRIGDNYVRMQDITDPEGAKEQINIGVEFAMSFTQQAFGALKNEKSENYNPNLHAILKDIRTRVNKYCSNRFNDLVRMAKRIQNEGKERTRTQALEFNDYLLKQFDTMQDRCKTASVQRNDVTADVERFRRAKVAFFATWNHEA